MSKVNMFAAFASDSDDEYKAVESKKQAVKTKTVKQSTHDANKVVGTRRPEEGDYDYSTNKPRPTRAARGRGGRGARGRGDRGRGARGRGGYEGEYRPRGERGAGRGRGRGARGRGGYDLEYTGPRDTYTKWATKEQVTGEGEVQEEDYYGSKRYYDKRSGTGAGREVKKHGAGKGGWGNPEEDRKLEHLGAEVASEIIEGEEAPKTEETKEVVEPEQAHEDEEKEEEEEDVNNLTYSEYMAQKKAEGTTLTKGETRRPEEINVANMQKYKKDNTGVKQIKSNIKAHEAYSMSGVSGDVEVGFQAVGEEPAESFESFDARGRGRGRGRGGYRGGQRGGQRGGPRGGHRGGPRGGPRGGHRGGPRDNQEAYHQPRGGKKKFVNTDEEFPSL
jgi:hypothetical protein